MKIAFTLLFALVLAVCAYGQTSNLAAIGMSYQPGGSPAVAGTGMYAKSLAASDATWAFTVVDALPASVKPFSVTTQVSAGVAQKVLTIGKITLYAPTAVGVSWSGTNTGWSWTTGGLAVIPLPKGLRVLPNVRTVKSSIGGSDYQLIFGALFGWGW